jgi:hypothetical protein
MLDLEGCCHTSSIFSYFSIMLQSNVDLKSGLKTGLVILDQNMDLFISGVKSELVHNFGVKSELVCSSGLEILDFGEFMCYGMEWNFGWFRFC